MGFRQGQVVGAKAAPFHKTILFHQQFGFSEEGRTNIKVRKQNEKSVGIDYKVPAPLSCNPEKELNLSMSQHTHLNQVILSPNVKCTEYLELSNQILP